MEADIRKDTTGCIRAAARLVCKKLDRGVEVLRKSRTCDASWQEL
jgi:hypothetical protein